jgi:WD40 repeat protein
VLDAETGRQVAEVKSVGRQVSQVCFLPGGKELAALVSGNRLNGPVVEVFEADSGKRLRSVAVDNTTYAIAVSPDGKLIAAANGQKPFSQFLDLESGKEVGRFPSTPSLWTLAFSPDGKLLAGARGYNGAVSVWDVAGRGFHPTAAEPTSFFGVRFSADGKTLALPREGEPLLDWRTGAAAGRLAEIPGRSGVWRGWCVSPDHKLIAAAELNGPVRLYDGATGKEVRALAGADKTSTSLTFSADGRRLASCGWDKVIRVWEVATGRPLAEFTAGELFGSDSLSLSRDGRVLAVTCHQNVPAGTVVYTWDVDEKAQLARIQAPTWFFTPVTVSPDGRLVAGGGGQDRKHPEAESAVLLWDATTGKEVHALSGHACQVVHPGSVCSFAPDGRLLATGDAAGRLRLWDVATGREVHRFEGHRTTVTANFSPDGRLLVAASEDAPCFVWDVAGTAGRERATPADPGKAWAELAGEDAKAAFQAARRLAASPDAAVALFREKLRPAAAVDDAKVGRLLSDLDAGAFAAREAATAELAAMADRIEPRLRAARASASAEAVRRLDEVLRRGLKPSPERVREGWAVTALEWSGTPEAARLLDELAGGAKDDRLTLAAAGARERLRMAAAK